MAGLFAFDGVPPGSDNPRVILLELAVQGIRGVVSASGRATFRPGYVVVPAGGDAFCATVSALLWCDPSAGEALRAGAGHAVRAGATFTTRDRTLHRLVTDFASEYQLQRYDAAARTFVPGASGRAAVTGWMHAQLGVPTREAFEDLFSVSAADLPSRAAARSTPAQPPPAATDPERIRARLEELRKELERSAEVERLQARVDDLHARLRELDEELREGERLRSVIASAEEAVRALGGRAEAADQLDDAEARLAAYERAVSRRDEAMSRISQEREALANDVAPPPLWRMPQLWAGIGAGVAALSVGLASGGALRYVALLDVPAFGWSAWTALRWVGRLEAEARAARRTRVLDERERKVVEAWEAEAGPVERAMKTAAVAGVAELRTALEEVAAARAALRAAETALAAWRDRPETAAASAERQRVAAELQDADAALGAAAGGWVRDTGTLEAEIARLEGELAAGAPPRAAGVASGEPPDELAELVRRAAATIGPDDAALARVGARVSEILAVIGGRRVEHLWKDPSGPVVVQPSGGRVPFRALPPDARDLCWTALKLALVEHGLAPGNGLAVVDGALDSLPLVAKRVAAHILKRAARHGQVLHATADSVFREAADHAA